MASSPSPNFHYQQKQQQRVQSRLPISVPPPRVPAQQPNNNNNKQSEIIYESVSSSHQSSNSHIYEIIGSERSAMVRTLRGEKPKVPPRNSSTGLTKVSKKVRLSVPSPQIRTKQEANNSHFLQQQNEQKVHAQTKMALNQVVTMPNVLQPNVLKYFQQKLYQSFGTGITNEGAMAEGNEMLFRYNNNNNNGPSNIFGDLNPISEVPGDNLTVVKQQQIDMMLETAQFLATAAYLER